MLLDDLNRVMDRFTARWAWVRHTNMAGFAEQAASAFALGPPPRIAGEVFPRLGIGVVREALPPGMLAVWYAADEGYVVRISPFLTAPRANFTLWHEFFEILATRPRFPDTYHRRMVERLADRFAACLTMPAEELALAAAPMRGRGDKSAALAARFGVSASAMRRRLHELKLPPFDTRPARVSRTV